jgi:hypothetical protein
MGTDIFQTIFHIVFACVSMETAGNLCGIQFPDGKFSVEF